MILVTFSGLDGCGKSTHVERTCAHLRACGLRTVRFDTVRASVTGVVMIVRERIVRWLTHGRSVPPAVGSTRSVRVAAASVGAGVARNAPAAAVIPTHPRGLTFDQERSRLLTRARRWVVYPFDCLAITAVLWFFRMRGYDAVVCDRYIQDKAVNLPNTTGFFWKLMRCLVPRPHLAIFLDTPPEVAWTRRSEHEPEYYLTKYAAYRRLLLAPGGRAATGLRPYPSRSIDEIQQNIEQDLALLLVEARRVGSSCCGLGRSHDVRSSARPTA